MSTFTLELALRAAGLILTGLVVANFVASKRWQYAENLANSSVIVRQIFYVHCAYIVAHYSCFGFAVFGLAGIAARGRYESSPLWLFLAVLG